MLIAENQSLPLVAAAMGHTNARMTLDKCTHLIEAARAEIREKYLRGKRRRPRQRSGPETKKRLISRRFG